MIVSHRYIAARGVDFYTKNQKSCLLLSCLFRDGIHSIGNGITNSVDTKKLIGKSLADHRFIFSVNQLGTRNEGKKLVQMRTELVIGLAP
jgi:hypothetical protein